MAVPAPATAQGDKEGFEGHEMAVECLVNAVHECRYVISIGKVKSTMQLEKLAKIKMDSFCPWLNG